ncbi:hypothetical protein SAMN04488540_1337 [Ferrimonas sediminum]|uniref:Uncharacterized protein n=1 Tax=Ferrimonas sediminum TaxID=718193 RepID=A0A1G9BPX4_9GAMM|nr:hypothetical protein [Ferrimonas sediminum]SDK41561.1 hypothetical protein SAMN04488540_1337 [Ferrimonas sediminum]
MQKVLGITLFAAAAVAALILGSMEVDNAKRQQVDSARAELLQPEHQARMFDTSDMMYDYSQPETPDINQLLQDYPTAAGAIPEAVRDNLAYEAAVEGDYEQAYRQMALAFKEGHGEGSYATSW